MKTLANIFRIAGDPTPEQWTLCNDSNRHRL